MYLRSTGDALLENRRALLAGRYMPARLDADRSRPLRAYLALTWWQCGIDSHAFGDLGLADEAAFAARRTRRAPDYVVAWLQECVAPSFAAY